MLMLGVAFGVSACDGSEPAPALEADVEVDVVRLSEAEERVAGIRTEVAVRGITRRVVEVPGSVQPPDTAQAVIGSIVDGRVVAVRVLPGDSVRAGQPLVEIHTHELSDAQSDLAAARAQLSYREEAFGRSEELLAAGAVSLEEVQSRRAALEAARAEVLRSEEMVEHLDPSPDGNATVVATRDGTVFAVHARMGQAVLPGTPLVEMGRTDLLWVTAFVPEQTASTLQPGDSVVVRFGTVDEVIDARLVRTGNFVDPSNRSVEMRFELARVPVGVRPGSFAVVEVTAAEAMEGVELEEEAAVRLADRDVVFVRRRAGEYRAVNVEVVVLREGRIAVIGLPEGAEVVVEGAYFLKSALEHTREAAEAAEAAEAEGAGAARVP